MSLRLGKVLALLLFVTTSVMCSGNQPFTVGEPDQSSRAGLAIDEEAMVATVLGGAAEIQVPISRTTTDELLEGTITLTMLDLASEELDRGEASFSIPAGESETAVTIEVGGLENGVDAGSLARYIVRYEVDADGTSLHGRRSLYPMARRIATVVLGSDDLYEDQLSQLRVTARDPASGDALSAARVELLLETPVSDEEVRQETIFSGITDEVGSIMADFTPEDVSGNATIIVHVEHDDGAAESRHAVTIRRSHRVLLSTDKPLYQPGQTIHIRALSFRLPNNQASADASVTFEVMDSRGNMVFREEQDANDFGVAATEFQLARQVNMGQYTIRATVDDAIQERTVTVDRYALPRFAIDFEAEQSFYLPSEVLRGQIDADYTFGQPVAGGEVVVRASQFDVDWVEFAELRGTTDEEGRFDFALDLPTYFVGLPLEQGGAFVKLAIEVTDTAGQKFEIERAITVANGVVSAYIVPERSALAPGVENDVFLLTADPTGAPLPTVCHVAIDGALPFPVETDERGFATFQVTPEDAGGLQITVEAEDGRGGSVYASQTLSTNGQATDTIMVRADRSLYEVGDSAVLSIYSPRFRDRVYLDIVRGGQTMLTDIVEVNEGWNDVDIDLSDQLSGPLTISVYYIALSGDIIRDQRVVYVAGGSDLELELSVDRETYRPAETARLDVRVSDAAGQAVQAAVGLQIVDEAVFALTEQNPGLERIFFELESELSQPAYEIHGFGTGDVFDDETDESPSESERQEAARVLFAAGADRAVYGIDYSSERALTENILGHTNGAVGADLRLISTRINNILDNMNASDYEQVETTLRRWINQSSSLWFDAWGQSYRATYESSSLSIESAGVDETWGTADDSSASTYIDLYRGLDGDDFWGFDEDGAGVPGDRADFEDEANADPSASPEEGGGSGGGEPRIRSWFPETLLVEPALITDSQGRATIDVDLADSITTWRASGIASSRRGQIGSSTLGITVFQDFFVDLALPATMTLGDEITVPVVVYNYLDEAQTVEIEVEDETWFTLLSPALQTVELDAREVSSVPLRIRVEEVGWHSLQAIGRAGDIADGLRRRIEVMPSGRRFDETQSDVLEGSAEGTRVSFDFDVPAGSVPDASELLVKVYPGVMAQAIEGLDSILRMPSGCFEQTSSATYPNVMVLHYMQETGSVTPEIEMQAREYISQGYQRLLTFEVDGGGFEWFGETPAHRILTAYGLMEFSDMARVHPVDPAVINRTAQWLANQQSSDGSWEPDPSGIAEGAINNYENDTYRTTAYVLWALLESGYSGPQISNAVNYLHAHVADASNSYSRAITAQALITHDASDTVGIELLDRLADDANDDGEASYWGGEEGASGLTYSSGDAHILETTALTIDAFMRARRHADLASRGLTFLVRNKDSFGNWSTTQATIYALRAMIRSMDASAGGAEGAIDVYHNGDLVETLEVDESNRDIMRQVDLKEYIVEGGSNSVELVMTGTGSLMYQTVGTYWTPWTDVPEEPLGALSIDVDYDRTNLEVDDTALVDVTVSNNTSGSLMMVMVDLGIPPGFDLLSDDVDALVESDVIERYESTPRQLLLYFDEIEAGPAVTFSYRIAARNPMRGEAPPSTAYLYYDPDVRVMAPPVNLEVE